MSISLKSAMNAEPIGWLQWVIAAMLTGVLVLDGLDLALAAFSAPVLLKHWHLTKPEFGPLLAAALVGMAFGSLIGSWCGDRFGRKPTLVASVVFFAVMTVVCGGASGPVTFVGLRFLCGIGFGAAFPVATTLMGEWMPPRAASKAISIMTLGIPTGIMLGALTASLTLPSYGWRWLFAGVGVVCLLFSAALWRGLPESPGFLVLKGRDVEAHANLSRAWGRPVGGAANAFHLEPKRESGRGLLVQGNARVNAGLWLGVLCASCMTYGIGGWLTLLLTGLRLPLATALRGPLTFSLSALVGAVVVGWMFARFGSWATMLLLSLGTFLSAAIAAIAAWTLSPGTELFAVLFAGLGVDGFCTGALQAGMYALAAYAYDTPIRARGMGVASLMSRVGAISSSFAGGALLMRAHAAGFFTLIATLAAIAALAVAIVDRHIRRNGLAGAPGPARPVTGPHAIGPAID